MSVKKKMGRPIIGKPKIISLHIKVDETTYSKIENMCNDLKISKAELIRQLVKKAK